MNDLGEQAGDFPGLRKEDSPRELRRAQSCDAVFAAANAMPGEALVF